jgi:processive 1,2-diacylglycerol beta-glucosyltransferase
LAPPRRLLILTAAVGDGHLSAARALAEELERDHEEIEVLTLDVLDIFGPVLRWILRDLYRFQLRVAPWAYGLAYSLFTRFAPARLIGSAVLALLGARRLRRTVRARAPDLVVSTYPAATSMLGHLRRRGRLDVPLAATITDLDGLVYWAHAGVDLHLVMHEACLEPVVRIAGPGSVRRVRPLVSPAFFEPLEQAEARARLKMPARGAIVLISGGGWGAGDLAGAVRAALALPDARMLVVAGRSQRVRHRLEQTFAAEERVSVLGFTDRMRELLAAADCLVHATGGVTCLEALVVGCPIVTYGEPPGHARLNDRLLGELGLADRATAANELPAALARALDRPRVTSSDLLVPPSAGSLVVGMEPRVMPRPHRRAPRVAIGLAALAALGGFLMGTDEADALVGRALRLRPVEAVSTDRPEVALVLRAPARQLPALAAELRAGDAGASFAQQQPPASRLRCECELIPELFRGGPRSWLEVREHMRREARALGDDRRFYYLAGRGLTPAEKLLARSAGGHPVGGVPPAGPLRRGDVIVLTLPDDDRRARRSLTDLLARVQRIGLYTVPVSRMLAGSASSRTSAGDRSSRIPPATTAPSETRTDAARNGLEPHRSATSSGASSTGTAVWIANTAGPT